MRLLLTTRLLVELQTKGDNKLFPNRVSSYKQYDLKTNKAKRVEKNISHWSWTNLNAKNNSDRMTGKRLEGLSSKNKGVKHGQNEVTKIYATGQA